MPSTPYTRTTPAVRPHAAVSPREPGVVLLIEDDAAFASDLSQAIRRHGLRVEHFSSFPDVGFVGRIESYAVIVLDYRLPALNGLEIAETCASLCGDRPVVLISNSLPTPEGRFAGLRNIRHRIAKSAGIAMIADAVAECVVAQVIAPL